MAYMLMFTGLLIRCAYAEMNEETRVVLTLINKDTRKMED